MRSEYDVIVVGARVAGATLAYELGRSGLDVLLLDENMFPSDTLSTHNLYGNSLEILREMGVLDKLLATGTPLYRRIHMNIEGAEIDGIFPGSEQESSCLCVRRLYFDNILLAHAKTQNRIRVLEGFTVNGVIRENGTVTGVIGQHRDGRAVSFAARLVVGADGRQSAIRQMTGSLRLSVVQSDYAYQVAYVSDFSQEGDKHAEYYQWQDKTAAVFPTSENKYVIGIRYPLGNSSWVSRFITHPETAFRALLEEGFAHTSLPARFRSAVFSGPVRGLHGYDNDWYLGMGKGWALVGDAFSFKDPSAAQGMHDALYSARLLAEILGEYHPAHWSRNWDPIATVYQSALEKKLLSRFNMACKLTLNVPVSAEMAALYRMIGADEVATRVFLGSYNYMNEPEDVDREIGRLLSSANALS